VSVPSLTLSRRKSLFARLISRRGSQMFVRNAISSAGTFAIDIALLWLLVGKLALDKHLAIAIAFFIANAVHYGLARSWIFPGSERGLLIGYCYFLANACLGLALIMAAFTVLNGELGIYYMTARLIASLGAGIIVFCLNATWNFHQL
tara:strand:+ start:831 stop:1274 length:444 start_codon:yes stop_codon:yes gene_type:complete